MPRTARALVAAATLLGGLPAAAHAAQLQVAEPCYADPSTGRTDLVSVAGEGFAPGQPVQIALAGRPVGSVAADAAGAVAGMFAAPSLDTLAGPAVQQRTFLVSAVQGDAAPATGVTISRLSASFSPTTGDPARMRVRFRLYGFALQGASSPPVYLHYFDPAGRLRRTVRLGTARGVCGRLTTSLRRLFPLHARPGTWRLQFDTRRRSHHGTARSTFLYYTLAVRISRPRR